MEGKFNWLEDAMKRLHEADAQCHHQKSKACTSVAKLSERSGVLPQTPVKLTPVKGHQTQTIPKDLDVELGTGNIIYPLSEGSAPSSQEMDTMMILELERAMVPLAAVQNNQDTTQWRQRRGWRHQPHYIYHEMTVTGAGCLWLPDAILPARGGERPYGDWAFSPTISYQMVTNGKPTPDAYYDA